MGRQKHDIGARKRRDALDKPGGTRAVNGEDLARALVRRGLAPAHIQSPHRGAQNRDTHGDSND